ncbi:MAG: acireductone synthase [Acidobacteriota bacterium]
MSLVVRMTKAILLDIEGTTTPISFVHETLFPYARERVGKFVETHFGSLSAEINELIVESSNDASYTIPVDPTEPGSISAYLEHLIDQDRKSTPLKSIQGRIWDEGFRSGELVAPIFDDVAASMKGWSGSGKTVAIYSSGSVLAQKLLFAHTNYGDLTPFISNYFDTTTGPKRESSSYASIARNLDIPAAEILFISDVSAELDAARSAGLQTMLSVRPGNAPLEGDPIYNVITTFAGLE